VRLKFYPNMRLTIEPIPESTWGISLANLLPPPIWNILRKEVYEGFNYTCATCSTTNKQLHCHEKWSYDDKARVQKLVGFQCLCEDCHSIKHWGRTVAEAHKSGDQSILAELTKHFCKVNKCTLDAFSLYKVEIGNLSQSRSRHKYKVDFGKFRPDLVESVWRKERDRRLHTDVP